MTEQPEKRMRLRYRGECRVCGAVLEAKEEAIYERATRSVRCLDHDDAPQPVATPDAAATEDESAAPVDVGVPGASARREFERRRAQREDRVRTKHPKLGGFLLAISDDPQTTQAWNEGAIGEERLGHRLNEFAGEHLRVLHDRRIPRSRANIDHLAVTPTGVWVIDAKRYVGRPHLVVEGGILRPRTEKLLVGNRDCTKLVDAMEKQIEVVRSSIPSDVPVRGALCFVEADWPLIGGPFTVRDVLVSAPKRLYPRLREDGPITPAQIEELHRQLADKLPPS